LSRRCPICHGDYGSIEYYAFVDIAENSGDDAVAGMATSLLARVKVKVIASSNVMIWCPVTKQLMFSLPVDTSVPKHEVQYLKSSINASDAIAVSGNTFSFTNRVWDAMEAAEEATEVMGVREMLAWVLHTLADPQNVLFTSLSQEQIIELMREAVRGSHNA
jgi:predicted XRE-type DNA-binding protein